MIEDDEFEDSPTDTPDLRMSERNEDDTMFQRVLVDPIPTKKHPQSVSGQLINQSVEKVFQRTGDGWYGLGHPIDSGIVLSITIDKIRVFINKTLSTVSVGGCQ